MAKSLGNAERHGAMIRKSLEKYRGDILDGEIFEQIVYALGSSAYSLHVNQLHENSSPLDID